MLIGVQQVVKELVALSGCLFLVDTVRGNLENRPLLGDGFGDMSSASSD